MDSLTKFFGEQRKRIHRSFAAADNRIGWARETGTAFKRGSSNGLLLVAGVMDVEERKGSIDSTSAMGPKRPNLANLDGEREI